MAARDDILCPMCGFKNPPDEERCRSCGAKVEAYVATYTAEEEYARRYQQDEFHWKWALLAAGVIVVLQGLVLGLLPRIISAYDPQGPQGLLLSVPVAFIGGIAVGLISPGKTFVEPAVGAMLAVIPTLAIVSFNTPDGFEPTTLAYVVCAALSVMMALFGAFLGERIQMSSRGHA